MTTTAPSQARQLGQRGTTFTVPSRRQDLVYLVDLEEQVCGCGRENCEHLEVAAMAQNGKSPGAPCQDDAEALQNGKSYNSSVADDVDSLQAEIDALPSLDEMWERVCDLEHRLDALKQELDAMANDPMPWETPSVELSEVSTRQAHADRMLSVRVDGERAGTVLKDAEGWRVLGDPRRHYASRGDAVDAIVAGRGVS